MLLRSGMTRYPYAKSCNQAIISVVLVEQDANRINRSYGLHRLLTICRPKLSVYESIGQFSIPVRSFI